MKPPEETAIEASKNKAKVGRGKPRNLTYDGMVTYAEQKKAEALAAVPAHEAVEINITLRDEKTGAVVLKNGFPTLVKQTVLKRDLVALEHDERIAELKRQAEASVA